MVTLPISCNSSDSKSGARHKVYPVQGELFVNGKPGLGVTVRLYPTEPLPQLSETRGGLSHIGAVDTDGVYKVSTYESYDGAPAAKYNIALTAMASAGGGFSRSDDNSADKLEGKYADAEANAKNDPTHFTVEVVAVDGKDPAPVKIPRIDLEVPGFWPDEAEKTE